jgi:hypothetical protein
MPSVERVGHWPFVDFALCFSSQGGFVPRQLTAIVSHFHEPMFGGMGLLSALGRLVGAIK